MKQDFSEVNEWSLSILNACSTGKEWFIQNIGKLNVSDIPKIYGDHQHYVEWLKYNFIKRQFTWDPLNREYIIFNRSKKTRYKYDKNFNCILYDDGKVKLDYTYENNKLVRYSNGGYWKKYIYENDLKIKTIDSDGDEDHYIYKDRKLIEYIDHTGFHEFFIYDNFGNLIIYFDSEENWEEMEYENNLMVTFESSNGNWKEMEYEDNLLVYEKLNNGEIIEERQFIRTESDFIQILNGRIEIHVRK